MEEETIKNSKAIEEMKKEEVVEVATTESLEVVESDPEDPDTSDWSHIYEEDKKEK